MKHFHAANLAELPRVLRKIGTFIAVFAQATVSLQAQQPVVLVHGFLSSGSTWEATALRLEQEYDVTTTRPNLPAGSTFDNQAVSLRNQTAGLSGTTIAIGHSNGGIVSREANREGRALTGIITVGTPHSGAPLAARVLDGTLFEYARYVIVTISTPFAYYSRYYPNDIKWQIGGRLGRWAASLGQALPGAIANIGFDISNPVLGEMVPGSPYLVDTLNSAENLIHEASGMSQRVAITSTVPTSFGNMWQAVSPDHYLAGGVTQIVAGIVFYETGLFYSTYNGDDDPWFWQKMDAAYMWFDAADLMFNMDEYWCAMIGAIDNQGFCTENDGVLPTNMEQYVGGNAAYAMVGPAHFHETRDSYATLARALQDRFGVSPRAGSGGSGGTGGSGYTVGITGPDAVTAGELNTWTAQISGGTPPYIYQWSGPFVVQGPSVTGSLDASTWIYLDVWDANYLHLTVSKHVNVSSGTCGGYAC